MVSIPRRIYKSLTKSEHANDFSRGQIILRSITFYRSYPCDSFRDFNEFSSREPGRMVGYADTNCVVFCAHKHKPADKNYLVEINSPCALFKYIRDIFGSSVKFSYFGEIYYKDPNSVGFPCIKFYCEKVYKDNLSDQLCINPGIETCFYKDPKWEYENEVRMCFFLRLKELSLLNRTDLKIKFFRRFIKLDIDRNSDKPVLKCQEELSFEKWKELRSCPNYNLAPNIPILTYREDFWFEIHITLPNSITKNFQNIS